MVALTLNPVPMRQQVLEGLRQAIIDGELPPGERLREVDLCKSTGVSRTVIREVLRQLEAEGLVLAEPNKGAVVRALTPEEALDIYRIRGYLEGLAARLFTENATPVQIGALARELDHVKAAYASGNVKRILGSKDRFYEVLFEGAGSETLCSILKSLNARISRWRALGLVHPERSRTRTSSTIKELQGLIKAVRNRDAKAAEQIAQDHVTKAAAAVMKLLDSGSKRRAA